MERTRSDHRKSLWAVCLLIILIPFSSCEKELQEKDKIYEDELKTTNNIELITTDTNEVSCPNETPSFRIEKKDDILKFRAKGISRETGEGKAVAKFHLSDLTPELSDPRTYSVRIHLKGELKFSDYRFFHGPIIKLEDEYAYEYYPTNDESSRLEYLEDPKSLTFHIDRGLSNFKVLDDEGQDVTRFFVREEEAENQEKITLTIGASGDLEPPGDSNCTTGALQLDGIEVFAR
jgi:uncharacterized protein YnzC (UPF0291/DUF896 family)